MGLDVYVGQMTRYYTQDWETIIQKYAREQGMQLEIARANPAKGLPREEALAIVKDWQTQLVDRLGGESWAEDTVLDYTTDKPDWDGYGALLLWAIDTKSVIKTKTFPREWPKSSLYRRYLKSPGKYMEFSHILPDCTIWVPLSFSEPIDWKDPTGNKATVGSAFSLIEQLKALNTMTWRASEHEIRGWRQEIDPNERDFSTKAKFGFSIFYCLTEFSISNRMPIKLDY